MILNAQTEFSFGKFKDRGVLNTWTGSVERDNRLLLRSYLRELIRSVTGNLPEKNGKLYPCLQLDIVRKELAMVKESSPHFSILVSDEYIVIDKLQPNDKRIVKEILQAILDCNLENTNRAFQPYPTIPFNELTPTSKGVARLVAEPDYLAYCVENIDNHCFEPAFLRSLLIMPSNALIGFHYSYLRDNIIKYSPKFRSWQYAFPEDLLAKNERNYSCFVFHNTDTDDDYDGNSENDQFSSSYAHDIEGWSDEDINDVLDGDPDAYWNID